MTSPRTRVSGKQKKEDPDVIVTALLRHSLELIIDDYNPEPPVTPTPAPASTFFRRHPAMPTKNRPLEWLKIITEGIKPPIKTTYHDTLPATNNKGFKLFYKKNPPGCPSIMAELEATAWAHYELIAPDYVPAHTRAIYDASGAYVGVSSQAIEGFKSTLEDPLKDDDLKNPEIVKGLAIGLMTSYLFEEDDCHRANMDKFGRRIDFDGSLWPIIGPYKVVAWKDRWFRIGNITRFNISEQDLDNFPDLKDAKPYYWPTTQPNISDTFRENIPAIIPISKNAFREADNAIYKKLAADPTFIYYKFRTLLKYILTDETMYRPIIARHLRKKDDSGANIIDILVKHQADRIESLTQTLVGMASFQEFMQQHGVKAFDEIREEFNKRNQKLRAKKNSTHEPSSQLLLLINPEELKQRFNKICNLTARRAYKL